MTTQPTGCPDWCMWRHEGHSPDFPDHTYDVYGFGEISQQPGHGAPLIWLGDRIAGKGMTAAEARSRAEMLQRGADDLDDQLNWRPSPPPDHQGEPAMTRALAPCPPWCDDKDAVLTGEHRQMADMIDGYVHPGSGDAPAHIGAGTSWTEVDGYPPLVFLHLQRLARDGALKLDTDIELTPQDAQRLIDDLARAIANAREATPADHIRGAAKSDQTDRPAPTD